MYKVVKFFFLICFFVSCAIGVASADYYVSKSGSDSNSGTQSRPFRTPQKAARVVSAGDTVYIKAGTYGSFSISYKNGTSGSWITFRPYQNDIVKIDSYLNNYANGGKVISVLSSTYIEINGLKITDSNPLYDSPDPNDYSQAIGRDGIKLTRTGSSADSHHIRVIGNELYHIGDMGILTGADSHHNEIINNNVHDNGLSKNGGKRGHGIYLIGDDNIVRGNIFHDCYSYGIHVWSSLTGLKPDRNLIEENLCYNNGHSDSYDTERGSGILVGSLGIDNIVRNNICYGNMQDGISVGWSMENTLVINNTLYKNIQRGIGVYSNADNILIRNNVAYQNKTNYFKDGTVTNTTTDHNLFGTDPKFVDPNNSNPNKRDYSLKPTSPAIDEGTASRAPKKDIAGNSRPRGSGYDIGAYEGSSSSEAPAPSGGDNCNLQSKFRITTVQNGMDYYTDRSYSFTNVPSKYIGMEMIKTPNDDKGNTCGSGYMEFTMPNTAKVYIAYDRRARDLPDWINGFNDTGDRINVSQALQGWMTVYSKQFSGGECVNFGCNKGRGFSGSSINNYIVFYGTSGSEQTGGSSDNCDLDAKFRRTTVQNGMNYYTDRSYSFTNVPSKYIGMEIIKTPNDDKGNTCGSGYMEFTMSNTAKVYVAYDRRARDLPDWMNGFNATGDRINVSQALQGWMTVYSKQFSGGECVGLGCNKGPGSSGSSINNYIVIVGD